MNALAPNLEVNQTVEESRRKSSLFAGQNQHAHAVPPLLTAERCHLARISGDTARCAEIRTRCYLARAVTRARKEAAGSALSTRSASLLSCAALRAGAGALSPSRPTKTTPIRCAPEAGGGPRPCGGLLPLALLSLALLLLALDDRT
jgi:hypothetical protein